MFFLFYILYLHSVRALLTYEESDRDVVLSQRPWSIAHAFHVDAFGLLIIEWGGFIVSQAFFIALFIIGYPMSIFPSYEYDALCRVFPCSELPSVIEAVLFGVEITLVIIAVLIERGGEYEVEELCREGGSGKENVLERINKFLSRFGLHRFEVYAVRILRIVVIIMILISIPLSIGLMIPAFISRAALSVYLSATFMMFAVILLAGVIMFILEMFVRVRVHELCRSRPTKPETLENRLGLF
ncbi:hypothetical protein [Vulcanisaeta distributa]|uniref:hypothetical protein n=1 Tax=Vulcanisaeta distributa TaxID=164451 RepID=UPI001FB462AE|nr:hypothetical protein [Vulcanisaeta distributa]